jgi:hypothetical protein
MITHPTHMTPNTHDHSMAMAPWLGSSCPFCRLTHSDADRDATTGRGLACGTRSHQPAATLAVEWPSNGPTTRRARVRRKEFHGITERGAPADPPLLQLTQSPGSRSMAGRDGCQGAAGWAPPLSAVSKLNRRPLQRSPPATTPQRADELAAPISHRENAHSRVSHPRRPTIETVRERELGRAAHDVSW